MTPDTFSQLYIHLIFVVKGRQACILSRWESELFKYMTTIIQNNNQKVLAINGTEDHIHILIGMKPSCRLSDLVREVKKVSSRWINENGFCFGKFEWQNGYAAFSYSQSAYKNVIKYIQNQKHHHKLRAFKDEYISFLSAFNIEFKPQFLPD